MPLAVCSIFRDPLQHPLSEFRRSCPGLLIQQVWAESTQPCDICSDTVKKINYSHEKERLSKKSSRLMLFTESRSQSQQEAVCLIGYIWMDNMFTSL